MLFKRFSGCWLLLCIIILRLFIGLLPIGGNLQTGEVTLYEIRSTRLWCLLKVSHLVWWLLWAWMCSYCACARYLCLLWELEGVYAISEVGGECVVQLVQRVLQWLECLFVLLQCLQLLLKADLPVHRLDKDTDSKSWVWIFQSGISVYFYVFGYSGILHGSWQGEERDSRI